MSLLEELLRYSKHHAQTVIVVLIGLNLVGSVGGWLWIQSANSNLSVMQNLQNQRLAEIEERYRTSFADAASKYDRLCSNLEKLEKRLNSHKDTVGFISRKIAALVQSKAMPSILKERLFPISRSLDESMSSLSKEVEVVTRELKLEEQHFAPMRKYKYPPAY